MMWVFYVIGVLVIFYLMDRFYPNYNSFKVSKKAKAATPKVKFTGKEELQPMYIEIYTFLYFKDYLSKVKNKQIDKELGKSLIFQLFSNYLVKRDSVRFLLTDQNIQDLNNSETIWFTRFSVDIRNGYYFDVVNLDFVEVIPKPSRYIPKVHSVISLVDNNNKVQRVFIVKFSYLGDSLVTEELINDSSSTVLINGNPELAGFQYRDLYFDELENYCF